MASTYRREALEGEVGGGVVRTKWQHRDTSIGATLSPSSFSHHTSRLPDKSLQHDQLRRRSEGILLTRTPPEVGVEEPQTSLKAKLKALRPFASNHNRNNLQQHRGIRKKSVNIYGSNISLDKVEGNSESQLDKSLSVDVNSGKQKQAVRRSVRFSTVGGEEVKSSPAPIVRTSGVGYSAENDQAKIIKGKEDVSIESLTDVINGNTSRSQHTTTRQTYLSHHAQNQDQRTVHSERYNQRSELTQLDKRYEPVGHEQDTNDSLEVSYIGEGHTFDQVKLFIDEEELIKPVEDEADDTTPSVSVGRIQVVKADDILHKRPGVNQIPWPYWQQGDWAQGFPDETLTMEANDISPGFAIRKIALLFENRRYSECTTLIRRLSHVTLKTIVSELPVVVLIEALPQSIQILDALYAKFFLAGPDSFPSQYLMPEKVVSNLIRWVSSIEVRNKTRNNSQVDNLDYYLPYCQNLMRVIAYVHPKVGSKLKDKRKGLNKCIHGLSQHGLVDTSESKLMNLHEALKIEFSKMIQQLKGAITQLESGSYSFRLPMKSSLTRGRTPSSASHQRLMQMSQREVQERLIKNKSLLNVVEPAMSNSYLASLIHVLESRINSDKSVLFHFAELRKEMAGDLPQNTVIVPLFQQYAFAHAQILGAMKEVTKDMDTLGDSSEEDDDLDGHLAESFSSTATSATGSGNSAAATREGNSNSRSGLVSRQKASFISSTTNSNGLMSRSKSNNLAASTTQLPTTGGSLVETKNRLAASTQSLALPRGLDHSTSSHMSGSTQSLTQIPNGTSHNHHLHHRAQEDATGRSSRKELEIMKNEVALLRKELIRCRETISKMQEREKQMKDRLSEHAIKHLEAGSKFENLNLGDNRPTQLILRYGNVYSQTRLDAFDALDDLPEMTEFDDLKGKLLFSVVVLAFRSVQHSLRQLRARLRHLLYLPDPRSTIRAEALSQEMEDTITVYLKKTVDKHDCTSNIQEVSSQVWSTLFDYPSLKSCDGLKVYIEECVTLAWALSVQVPALTIDYESRIFDPNYHTRFHTSDPDTDQVKAVLWPALVESDGGPCVHKAVVIT